MIAAATHRNGGATITTTFGDGRMSRRVFRQRDSNLRQCFTPFAASAGCFNRGKSEAGSTCFGLIARGRLDPARDPSAPSYMRQRLVTDTGIPAPGPNPKKAEATRLARAPAEARR